MLASFPPGHPLVAISTGTVVGVAALLVVIWVVVLIFGTAEDQKDLREINTKGAAGLLKLLAFWIVVGVIVVLIAQRCGK